MPLSPEDVVRTALTAMQDADTETALALIDPDLEWRNSGLPTLRGKRALDAIRSMEKAGVTFAVDFHHVAADGPVVLTDRTDWLGYGRFRTAFWVCGTFEVRDGRIVLWDDRFSVRNMLAGAVRGAVAGLRGSQARTSAAAGG